MNEGIAVHVSRMVSPGHAAWEYFGYGRREYARVREAEAFITRTVFKHLGRAGLGLRLRYLSGGMSEEARTIDHHILPERSGYFIGTKMTEAAIATHGLSWVVRANAEEITAVERNATATA
jgi:hypothetical protein